MIGRNDQTGALAAASAVLRADGERLTGTRLAVLAVLEAADGHLSAAELHQRVLLTRPLTNLSTVYRTVERLTELGVVHVLTGAGEALFGLSVQDHHHAICDSYGRVVPINAKRWQL